MRKKFVQLAAGCLTAVLLAGSWAFWPSASAATEADTNVRVGLVYGSSAMDGSNVANEVGTGYDFGYYDSANRFVKLGSTTKTGISVVKTTNVGYTASPSTKYYNYQEGLAGTASVVVGCYHLQLPGTYSTYEQAQAAVSLYSNGFVAYIGGTYYARVGNYVDKAAAQTAQAELAANGVSTEIKGTSGYGVSVVVTGTNTILFQYDDLGNGTGLGVKPISTGAESTTWFMGYCYYGGFRFERVNGGDLVVVNMVEMDTYLNCVVSVEMSNSWPLEALKAQAVAARNYYLSSIGRHESNHFDICGSTHCQAYYGMSRTGSNTAQAVAETAGVVATYNGKYVECYYYSSNGGASMDSSLVWGSSQSSYPYLLGVTDPYEATVAGQISGYNWTKSYTASELTSKLQAKGYACSTITGARVSVYTDEGNPEMVVFTDDRGKTYTLNTRTVVAMLGLRSYRYDFAGGSSDPGTGDGQININGDTTVNGTSGLYAIDGTGNKVALGNDVYVITDEGTSLIGSGDSSGSGSGGGSGTFTVSGSGWGHNVGMSQWGAYAMAKQGYTYDQILKFYYTGITVG